MIKGNMSILLEYDKMDADINELKLMIYNDNLSKHIITGWNDDIEQIVTITLIYDNIDCYKFKAEKVNDGLLITDDAEYFSFIN